MRGKLFGHEHQFRCAHQPGAHGLNAPSCSLVCQPDIKWQPETVTTLGDGEGQLVLLRLMYSTQGAVRTVSVSLLAGGACREWGP